MSLDRRSPASIACERDSIVRGARGILDLTVGGGITQLHPNMLARHLLFIATRRHRKSEILSLSLFFFFNSNSFEFFAPFCFFFFFYYYWNYFEFLVSVLYLCKISFRSSAELIVFLVFGFSFFKQGMWNSSLLIFFFFCFNFYGWR